MLAPAVGDEKNGGKRSCTELDHRSRLPSLPPFPSLTHILRRQ